MKEFLNTLPQEAVIVGGVARWLNGYKEQPESRWIDISIPVSATGSLDSLGSRLEIKEGTSFPLPVKEQYIIRTKDYFLDVFVNDQDLDYTVVSGSKVITPKADLDWHMFLSSSAQSEIMHDKVVELTSLYNIVTT